MRIISGKYRGKNLAAFDTNKVRPTSDRAREALYSILRSRLGFDFSQLQLIDVFAGSGAFALEALSQGFAGVAMVDLDIELLQKNLKLFPNEAQKAKIIRADATRLGKAAQAYDVLFMDAPYRKGLTVLALQALAVGGWLKPEALCLIEIERREKLELPDGFELVDERAYGLAKVVLASFVG